MTRATPFQALTTGLVGGRLKAELYANATAFVLDSTIEGRWLALIEAMEHEAFGGGARG